MNDTPKTPGPTGEFPDGQWDPTDEGELAIGITTAKGKVVINFGTEVRWLGLQPQEAVDLAEKLIESARKASTEPLTVTIPFD